MKGRLKERRLAFVALSAFAAALAVCSLAASSALGSPRSTGVLTMESSPQNAITDNFNPYVT
jgi:hypothetical protein